MLSSLLLLLLQLLLLPLSVLLARACACLRMLARADGIAWAWARVRDLVCMSYPGQTCQLLSCLVALCMCDHCSLLILNLHTSNPNLNLQSMALSAFVAGLKLLAFRWSTSWGTTGAADGAGAGPGRGAREAPGSRSSLFSHPPNLIFQQPRTTLEPQNRIVINNAGGQKTLFNRQEAPGSLTFGRHVSNRLRIRYSEFSHRELSMDIYIYIYMYGSNQRGGGGEGSGGIRVFWTLPCPPSKNLLGHSYKILNISAESSAQAQSIGTLFEQIGLREGGCGHVQKSEAQALGCRPRGWSSQ